MAFKKARCVRGGGVHKGGRSFTYYKIKDKTIIKFKLTV